MSQPLVAFNQLSVAFQGEQGRVRAVQQVSFDLYAGQTLGVVGESGCGKSVTAMALMGLLPQPLAQIDGGEIHLDGQDLLKLRPQQMADLREPLIRHRGTAPKAAWREATALITEVGLARAEQLMTSYPHQLSGGMLQRIMIAMAISCRPALLIADEPTTALDVTVQAQILALLREQARKHNMAMMLITHDLGVIAQMADRLVVMYAGRIVEQGATHEVLANPQHPYTQGLMASRPVAGQRRRRLYSIPGQVPDLASLPDYCAFAERCDKASARCRDGIPPLYGDRRRQSACFLNAGGRIHVG